MAEFVAGRGTTALSIIGTVLGSLGVAGNNNGLGILGGRMGTCDGNNMPVSRFELEQQNKISALEAQVALRDANTYNDQKVLEVYKYFDGKIEGINRRLCDQATYNATNTATINCMAAQIAQLQGLTKLVIPNSSVCPGWGNVTVTPATAPTTAG